MKMSGSLKPYLTVLILILLAALLVGPPVAFAGKLPTVCNLFLNKSIQKNGPCGNPGAISHSQESLHEEQSLLTSIAGSGADHCSILFHVHYQSFLAFPLTSLISGPLRC